MSTCSCDRCEKCEHEMHIKLPEFDLEVDEIDGPTIDVKIFILFLLLGFLFGFLGSNPYKTWAWSKS